MNLDIIMKIHYVWFKVNTFRCQVFFIWLIGNQNSTFQLIQANLNWLTTAEKGWNFWLWVSYIQIISFSVKLEVVLFEDFMEIY